MKKRCSEGQLVGFLREPEASLPVKELCRRHGVSEVVTPCGGTRVGDERLGRETSEGAEHPRTRS